MIPEGWIYEALGNHIFVKHGFAFKSNYFDSEGQYILLTPGNFHEKGGIRLIPEKFKYYIGSIPQEYILSENDLLVVMTEQAPGLLGSAALIPENNKYLHNQRLGLININNLKVIDINFIYFVFNSWLVRRRIEETASGTKVKHTSPSKIHEIIIPIPPLPEQRKIAEILGAWDESIALLEKLITAKRKLKQGLMQQLLTGKKRFKEFEGSEWKTVSIEEIAFVDRRSLRSNTPEYYTFRYISLSDINNGEISKDLPEICFAEAPSRARKLVSNNDIIMATVRPNLKAFSIIKSDADKYVVSTGFAVITTKKGYSADYLYQYIFSDRIEQQINALVTGSNYPAINSSEIKQLSVYCPSFPEQEKIASVLSATDTEISTLEKQLAAYKQQKRGLMQQLLTGKTRVNVN